MHLQVYESKGNYYLPAKLPKPSADEIFSTCKLISKKSLVDRVQNHIHTVEPEPNDVW